MTPEPRPASLAVLIDADNTSARYARAIFEEIAKLGEANVRRIYGDFADDRLKGWREVMQQLAIVPAQQFNYTTGKNAADITLVIEAMDLMHRGHLDGFCLVSSDSDFTRLASRLREEGAVVYGFGAMKTPEAFRNACNQFIYVENLLADGSETPLRAAPSESRSTPSAKAPKTTPEVANGGKPQEVRAIQPSTKAVPMILKAMKQMEDDDGWFHLGALGSVLRKLHPDFDPRTYGCDKLSDLATKTGHFRTMKVEGSGTMIALKQQQATKTSK